MPLPTGDIFLPTAQIPLNFPCLEESKIKHLQQAIHKVDNPQADCRYLMLQKRDGSVPGGDQTSSCGIGFALRGHGCRPPPTAGGLYPSGRQGRGACRMSGPRLSLCLPSVCLCFHGVLCSQSTWCLSTRLLGPPLGSICCPRGFGCEAVLAA